MLLQAVFRTSASEWELIMNISPLRSPQIVLRLLQKSAEFNPHGGQEFVRRIRLLTA
jgi:hypothetical protein